MLYYLYNEGNLNSSTEFWTFLHRQFSKDIGEKVMTLGQQAVQQAVQQTIEQTREQESQKTALRMLEEKIDITLISKITKLSPEAIKILAKKKHNLHQ